MSQGIIDRFQELFPPMYKEGEGLKYSLSVLVHRIRILAIGAALFVVLASACWFIVPVSISTLNDWYGIVPRFVLVSFLAWIAWIVISFYRKLSRDMDEMHASRKPVDDESEMKELAALAATMFVVSYSFPSTRQIETNSNFSALLQVAREIESHEQTPLSEFSKVERQKIRRKSLETAFETYNLFAMSGYTLTAPGQVNEDVIAAISQKVAGTVKAPQTTAEAIVRIPSLSWLSGISKMDYSESSSPKGEKKPEDTIAHVIRWLRSINVGLNEHPLSGTTIRIKVGKKNKKD